MAPAGLRLAAAGSLALAVLIPPATPAHAEAPYDSIASLPAACDTSGATADPQEYRAGSSGDGNFSTGDTLCFYASSVVNKSQPNWTVNGFTYNVDYALYGGFMSFQHFQLGTTTSNTVYRLPIATDREINDATLTITLPPGSGGAAASATPRLFIAEEAAVTAQRYPTALTSTSTPPVPTPTMTTAADGSVIYTYSFANIPAGSRMMLTYNGTTYQAGQEQFISALLYGTRVFPELTYAPGLGTEADPYIFELNDLIPGEDVIVRVPVPAASSVTGQDEVYEFPATADENGSVSVPLTWENIIPGSTVTPEVVFPKVHGTSTGLETTDITFDELSVRSITTPNVETTQQGLGTTDSPWINTYTGLLPGDSVEVTVTVPADLSTDGQEHTYVTTATADQNGTAEVPLTWENAQPGSTLPVSVAVTHPASVDLGDGPETPGVTESTVVDPLASEVTTASSETVSTGSGLGTEESPWEIAYTGLQPETTYTVSVRGPDGEVSSVEFTTDAEGNATVDLTWPADAAEPGTELTATLLHNGTEITGLDQQLSTPDVEVTSEGMGTEDSPRQQVFSGLTPGDELVVTVTVPADQSTDGQEHTYPVTVTVGEDGTAAVDLTWENANPGASLPVTVTVNGADAPSLSTTATTADPQAETVSTGDAMGTPENPWQVRYTDLLPETEYTVTVTGPDGELSTQTFTTDADGAATVDLTWDAEGVAGGSELSATVTSTADTRDLGGLSETQTTPSSQTTDDGNGVGTANNPWSIAYTNLSPNTEYTVTVAGPDGELSTQTFTTDADGGASVDLTWPAGSAEPGSELTATVTRDGATVPGVQQSLTAALAPESETVSTGDGMGGAESPWVIDYRNLLPNTEYTVTPTLPDGTTLDPITFTTNDDGTATVDVTWDNTQVDPGTEITAVLTEDGTTVDGVEQTLTTPLLPESETISTGDGLGTAESPWVIEYRNLEPNTTYTVTPVLPDGTRLEPVTFTTDDSGTGRANVTWSDGDVPSGSEVTAEISSDGSVIEGLEQTITAATTEPTEEPTPEPTEEPTTEPTAEPTPEPTEEPTAEPTEEPTPEPTTEPTEEPTAEPTTEPTAEPTAEPTEEPTPVLTPDSVTVSTGDGQGTAESPWLIDYTQLRPNTTYTVTPVLPDGTRLAPITFTTDDNGAAQATVTWPVGAVPANTWVRAVVTLDGQEIASLEEFINTPSASRVSSGDDQGTEANPWRITYTSLTPNTTYTVVVTGPDGEVTTTTFTTDAAGRGTVNLSWSEELPDNTELTASISRDGVALPSLDSTLTTGVDVEPEPVPEPGPQPEPAPEPTPEPSPEPSVDPTEQPSPEPTEEPTAQPSPEPTEEPTAAPTVEPTVDPTQAPTAQPSVEPTGEPTTEPTGQPSPEQSQDPDTPGATTGPVVPGEPAPVKTATAPVQAPSLPQASVAPGESTATETPSGAAPADGATPGGTDQGGWMDQPLAETGLSNGHLVLIGAGALLVGSGILGAAWWRRRQV